MNDSNLPETGLLLFVANDELANRQLYQRVSVICGELNPQEPRLTMVDVRSRPDLARRHQVFITPMLLEVRPTAERRIFGDLADREHLLASLKA